MKRLIAVALACCAAQAGATTFFTGNQLLEKCNSDNTVHQVGCMAYVMGILDGATLNGSNVPFVIPSSSDAGQLKDVVLKYLNSHPEHRHWPASMLVWNAMADAFPKSK